MTWRHARRVLQIRWRAGMAGAAAGGGPDTACRRSCAGGRRDLVFVRWRALGTNSGNVPGITATGDELAVYGNSIRWQMARSGHGCDGRFRLHATVGCHPAVSDARRAPRTQVPLPFVWRNDTFNLTVWLGREIAWPNRFFAHQQAAGRCSYGLTLAQQDLRLSGLWIISSGVELFAACSCAPFLRK